MTSSPTDPRWLAVAAGAVAAAIHLALAVTDLIPGYPTQGWVFAAMGLGYLGCVAGVMLRRDVVDDLIVLYAAGLILAYAASRSELPVEPIGLTSKAAEAVLAVTLIALRLMRRGRAHAGRG